MARPTALAKPWPRGPVVTSIPGVSWASGWPGVMESTCCRHDQHSACRFRRSGFKKYLHGSASSHRWRPCSRTGESEHTGACIRDRSCNDSQYYNLSHFRKLSKCEQFPGVARKCKLKLQNSQLRWMWSCRDRKSKLCSSSTPAEKGVRHCFELSQSALRYRRPSFENESKPNETENRKIRTRGQSDRG